MPLHKSANLPISVVAQEYLQRHNLDLKLSSRHSTKSRLNTI
ncbi:hypothetical protein [Helicobacter salomonis]|nr:hypothetical protein [Helicobacter salomonis]